MKCTKGLPTFGRAGTGLFIGCIAGVRGLASKAWGRRPAASRLTAGCCMLTRLVQHLLQLLCSDEAGVGSIAFVHHPPHPVITFWAAVIGDL